MGIAFFIWSVCSLLFVFVGIGSWRSQKSVGFFNGVKPPEVKDVTAYNHAVAKIWITFAILLEILGIPLIFLEQNSPYFLLVSIAAVFLIIGIIIAYLRVEQKYKV